MDKLRSILNLGQDFSILVFFGVKVGNEIVMKKADIQPGALADLANAYKNSILAVVEEFDADDEKSVLHLSEVDDRANVVVHYDLDEGEPEFFNKMREVAEHHETVYWTGEKMFNFTAEADKLANIKYFVMRLGSEDNHIEVYTPNYPINLYRRDKGFVMLFRSDTQFAGVEGDLLRISAKIDVVYWDNKFFILDQKMTETHPDFVVCIQKKAASAIDIIDGLNLVADVAPLRNRVSEVPFAKRIMKAVYSSHVINLSAEEITAFVRNNEKVNKCLPIKDDKLEILTNKSQNMLLKVLNDDILKSNLTKKDYKSRAKDSF